MSFPMPISNQYVNIIGIRYPNIKCSSFGPNYNNINLLDGSPPLPSQAQLDLDIRDQAQMDMWGLIKTERDRRKTEGGYKVGNYWFHSDDTSRIQQLGLMIMGANMPPGLLWKTLSGSYVPMTPTLAQQIFMSAATSDTILFSTAEAKRTAMMAMTDPSTFSYLTGWPKVYGE